MINVVKTDHCHLPRSWILILEPNIDLIALHRNLHWYFEAYWFQCNIELKSWINGFCCSWEYQGHISAEQTESNVATVEHISPSAVSFMQGPLHSALSSWPWLCSHLCCWFTVSLSGQRGSAKYMPPFALYCHILLLFDGSTEEAGWKLILKTCSHLIDIAWNQLLMITLKKNWLKLTKMKCMLKTHVIKKAVDLWPSELVLYLLRLLL